MNKAEEMYEGIEAVIDDMINVIKEYKAEGKFYGSPNIIVVKRKLIVLKS